MLLLALLIVTPALASENDSKLETWRNPDYTIKIIDHTLTMVRDINQSSSELKLSNRDLRAIDQNAFDELDPAIVTSLDLSNNSLTDLPEFIFSDFANLKHLSLANNRISRLKNAFHGLGNLRTLDISNNLVSFLDRGYFFGLSKNCMIIAEGNPISRMHRDVFESPLSQLVLQGYDTTSAKICIHEGSVTSVDYLKKTEILKVECTAVKITNATLNLQGLGISTFANGWYRITGLLVRDIDLSANNIARVTSDFFNDLPADLQGLDLRSNQIAYLQKESIFNNHLRSLDLSQNGIRDIEDDAFATTKLLYLNLDGNRLTNTRFVATLPLSLRRILLNDNDIMEITPGSFSELNHLTHIELNHNKIKELKSDSLRGLSTLQYLNLTNNGLQTIEPGAFQDLMSLEKMDLSNNSISSLRKSSFVGLRKIKELVLSGNKLKNVTREWLSDLPDTLCDLWLNNNEIESLRAGTFVRVPRLFVSLNNNKISTIEEGSFDLPNVDQIFLDNNRLTELNGDSWQGLPALRSFFVASNRITKIAEDAFDNLGCLEYVDLSENPIRRLENRALYRVIGKNGVHGPSSAVELTNVPLESVLAGIFKE